MSDDRIIFPQSCQQAKIQQPASALRLPQLVPTLQVISFNARNTNIIIRGLGTNISLTNDGIESGVGVYVDGVLYSRPAMATFDLADIATIEVLRGPQGTLYGKNTTAGAINITTELPVSEFESKGEISFGGYGYRNYKATISGPINDSGTLLWRLTAYDTDRDGFIYNVTTKSDSQDFHDYGFRAQMYYRPTSNRSVRVIADYAKQHERCCIPVLKDVVTTQANGAPLARSFRDRAAQAGYMPLPINPFARITDANSPYHEIMEDGGLSGQADWNFSGLTLTSISAFRFWNWNPDNDTDQTALSILTRSRQANQSTEFTQELRLSSPVGQRVEYGGGLYYFSEKNLGSGNTTYGPDAPVWIFGANTADRQAALNGVSLLARWSPHVHSYSAFGQVTWHVTPKIDLTGGIRYTYEDKSGYYTQDAVGGADRSTLTPTALTTRTNTGLVHLDYTVRTHTGTPSGMASASYHFTDDITAYATYARGSRSGGITLTSLPAGVNPAVEPEYIDNYELGLKSLLLNNRLALNVDVFWENDSNYQATLAQFTNNVIVYIANIPLVRSSRLLKLGAR